MTNVTTLLVLAAIVQQFTEVVNRNIKAQSAFELSAQQRAITTQLVAIIAGVAVLLVADINIFEDFDNTDNLFGTVLTGTLVGFGSDVVNGATSWLYEVRNTRRAEVAR